MRLYKLTYTILCLAPMFAGCAVDDGAPDKPNATVHMTVDVTRGDGSTRSILKENGGDLSCNWQTTDVLVVTDAQGNELGMLKVKEIGTDASKATFAGDIDGVADGSNVTFNYIYLGNKGKTGVTDANATYTVDYTGQNGTLASLSDRDVMTASATGSVKDGVAIVPGVELVRKVSFAKFALTLKGDGAISNGATVSISGTGLKTSLALDKKNTEATVSADDGTITLANVNPSELYVTLLPSADIKELNFTVTSGESTYSGKYTVTKGVSAGKYYRKENGDGTYGPISIEVAPAQDPVDEDVVGPVFEVNGKKFRFTRANLKYNVDTKEWSLMERQYSFLCHGGWANSSGTWINPKPEDNEIDLFGYGATGLYDKQWDITARQPEYWKDKAASQYNKDQDNYYPTSNSKVNEGYTGSNLQHGIQFSNFDWGKAYYLYKNRESMNSESWETSYDKEETLHYFTLSSSDWTELRSKYFMCGVTITGLKNPIDSKTNKIYGLLIFEVGSKDAAVQILNSLNGSVYINKSLSDNLGFTGTNYQSFKYNYVQITSSQFDELEKKGIVFLPEVGRRGSHSLTTKEGAYWTSTNLQNTNAINFRFDGDSSPSIFKLDTHNARIQGCSVRLVKEVLDDNK